MTPKIHIKYGKKMKKKNMNTIYYTAIKVLKQLYEEVVQHAHHQQSTGKCSWHCNCGENYQFEVTNVNIYINM